MLVNNAGVRAAAELRAQRHRGRGAASRAARRGADAPHARRARPDARSDGSGRIVNVASVAGFIPRSTYGACKGWLISFSRWANGRYAARGVTVTAVCPGFTHTNFHERMGLPPGEEGVARLDVARRPRRRRASRCATSPAAGRCRSRRCGTRRSSRSPASLPAGLVARRAASAGADGAGPRGAAHRGCPPRTEPIA